MRDPAKEYSPESFGSKVRNFAAAAGREVIEKALVLYHCLRDPRTPSRAKAIIIGALGYFILPLDIIPDIIPGAGYTDDLGGLVLALATVAAYIRPEHREKAREQLSRLFGPRVIDVEYREAAPELRPPTKQKTLPLGEGRGKIGGCYFFSASPAAETVWSRPS